MKNFNKNRLQEVAANNKSNWVEKARWNRANKDWLAKSRKIALRVARTLRSKNMTQKDLADVLGVKPQQVNKILKGKENLSLETISKLESALEISLVEIPQPSITFEVSAFDMFPNQKIYPKSTQRISETKKLSKISGKRTFPNEVDYHLVA